MRILLVEDDPKIGASTRANLEESGYQVTHSLNAEDALTMIRAHDFALAIVDIMLPGMDGLSFIKEIRSQNLRTPVLIVSAKYSVDDRVKGLEVGSDDYLTKPFAFSELLARVQALIRRNSLMANSRPSNISVGDLDLDYITRGVTRAGKEIDLQPREFSLLECLMRNAGQPVSKAQILQEVWNSEISPAINIVDVLICRLRNKIDRDFEKPMIHTLRSVGYVLKAA